MTDNLFDGLTESQIKDSILRYYKEIQALNDQKKQFTGAIRDQIKEFKERIDLAYAKIDELSQQT